MYVVVGANGFLGSYFIKNILANTSERILAIARTPMHDTHERIHWVSCDITDAKDVIALNDSYLKRSSQNKVIYLAAYHHPDLVEKNPRTAWNVNVTSLSFFLNTIDNVSSFYYPSSDSVYGESIGEHYFNEADSLQSVNRYGVQKSVAEKIVTAYGHHVVRYPFLIGPSLLENKKHFYDTIVSTIAAGKTMEMFQDSRRSAISFDMAAQLVIRLIEAKNLNVPQILNVCGDDALSKYDIGLMIADKIGASRNLIKPISIHQDNGVFEAKRAASTLMDNSRLKELLDVSQIKLEL